MSTTVGIGVSAFPRDAALVRPPPEFAHLVQPALAGLLAHALGIAEEGFVDRLHACEGEDIALQSPHAMRAEEPAIDHRRHAHCDHDAGRAAGEQLFREAVFLIGEGCPRPEDLFEKGLQKRRHGPEPEREDEHDMFGGGERRGRGREAVRQRAMLELLLGPHERDLHPREAEHLRVMAGGPGALGIGRRERMAEAAIRRVGMAVDDEDPLRHGLSLLLSEAGRPCAPTGRAP